MAANHAPPPRPVQVRGLAPLVSRMSEEIHAAALRWCRSEGVGDVALIAEARAELK